MNFETCDTQPSKFTENLNVQVGNGMMDMLFENSARANNGSPLPAGIPTAEDLFDTDDFAISNKKSIREDLIADKTKEEKDDTEETEDVDEFEIESFRWQRGEIEKGSQQVKPELIEEQKKIMIERIDEPHSTKVVDDLIEFEKRMGRAGFKRSDKLIFDSYKNINRILDDNNQPFDLNTRVRLVAGITSQLANPTSINQGIANTCGAASFETSLYLRRPDLATKVVADLATTGSFQSKNYAVKLDKGSLIYNKLNDRLIEVLKMTGETVTSNRTHASQLFQVAAVNLAMNLNDTPVKYVQRSTTTDIGGIDYGDGFVLLENQKEQPLLDLNNNPVKFEGLKFEELTRLIEAVSGSDSSEQLIIRSKSAPGYEGISFQSEAELKDILLELKRSDGFPRLAVIFPHHPPLSRGDLNSQHAISILDYDPKTDKVQLDNQWDQSFDHTGDKAISTRQLHRQMTKPGFDNLSRIIKKWKSQLEASENDGKYEPLLDYKITMGKNATGEYKNLAEFEDQLSKTWRNIITHWEYSPEKNIGDKSKIFDHFSLLMASLSEDSSNRVIEKIGKQKLVNSIDDFAQAKERTSTTTKLSLEVLKCQISRGNSDLNPGSKFFDLLKKAYTRDKGSSSDNNSSDYRGAIRYLELLANIKGPKDSHLLIKRAKEVIDSPLTRP